MDQKKLLGEIQIFKENLKRYRDLTELYVRGWNPSTPLNEKLTASEEDELEYQTLKSDIGQKLSLFGEELKQSITVRTYDSGGNKKSERSGIGYILTLASNLIEERLEIYNFNHSDREYHKIVWSIVLHGIEKYTGSLKYYDERRDNLVKREEELKKKEEELERQKVLVNSMETTLGRLMKIFTDTKDGPIESIRSGYIAQNKENHRRIEQNTNPNTKSQNN